MLEKISNSLSLIEEYISNILRRLPVFKLEEDIRIDKRDWELALSFFELNKNKFSEKIHILGKSFTKDINDIISEWEKYTEFYKSYIYSTTLSIAEYLKDFIDYLDVTNNSVSVDHYDIYIKRILNIYTGQNLLKNFSYMDKNYIILGRNSSGKTTLLKRITNDYFKFNAVVVPANRDIDFKGIESEEEYSNLDLFDNVNFLPNDILTYELCVKRNDLCDEVKNIFDSLSFGRKLFIDSEHKRIMLYSEGFENDKYSISKGSDGEKSAFLFISLILSRVSNSLVLIDEPENHLNTALLNELFDILEKKRRDITFIYCTHNVDFIESRNKPNLIYLSGYNDKNDGIWDLNTVKSFDSLSIQNIVDIVGTKKKILFTESKPNRIDYRFYTSLFSDFKVISLGSCDDVINNCKAINPKDQKEENNYRILLNLNRSVYGIIDKDSREEKEIKKLKKSNVFVLLYDEIENLFISSVILDKICEKNNLVEKKEQFKEKVINYIESHKNEIISAYVNKTYKRKQKSGKYEYRDNLRSLIKNIKDKNKSNLNEYLPQLEIFINNLDKYIKNKDYEQLVMNIQNKGILSCVSVFDLTIEDYIDRVIELIKNDNDFRKEIIKNHFVDFAEIV